MFVDDFHNGRSVGNASGIDFAQAGSGGVALFSRSKESRITYPYKDGFPREGYLEMDVLVDRAYSYSNFKLNDNIPCALLFTTDIQGGDVTWPGSAWLRACKDGTITFHIAGEKHEPGHKDKYKLEAKRTEFRFGAWARIGIGFGSAGSYIVLNGKIVAANPAHTQELGGGGTQQRSLGQPTIGEATSSFWRNNQHDGGFEGTVARVWVGGTQLKKPTEAPARKPTEAQVQNRQGHTKTACNPEDICKAFDLKIGFSAKPQAPTEVSGSFMGFPVEGVTANTTNSLSYDITPANLSLLTAKSYKIVLNARIELEEHSSARMGWLPLPIVVETKRIDKTVEIHVKKANGFREKGQVPLAELRAYQAGLGVTKTIKSAKPSVSIVSITEDP
ncbi:hypothetical protein [Azospirillum isscasi]|uniref:LamG domain-containing protein n=1 Tax=Azospirillum isscasi TaxID=3053926 RepID=A0ABU0WV15_9PROT|nr:hypothetical protein [Azospirillum isscasi]MDQ2106569.1 hypothetical protein [Azospirillum isscasi]